MFWLWQQFRFLTCCLEKNKEIFTAQKSIPHYCNPPLSESLRHVLIFMLNLSLYCNLFHNYNFTSRLKFFTLFRNSGVEFQNRTVKCRLLFFTKLPTKLCHETKALRMSSVLWICMRQYRTRFVLANRLHWTIDFLCLRQFEAVWGTDFSRKPYSLVYRRSISSKSMNLSLRHHSRTGVRVLHNLCV